MPRYSRFRSASPTSKRWRCSRICSCWRCPSGDPRADATRIAADDIDQSRLILLEDGHCLRDQALAFCATARNRVGGAGGTAFGASSLTTVIQMVANGYGMTLIPQIAADVERRDDRVKFLRLSNTY